MRNGRPAAKALASHAMELPSAVSRPRLLVLNQYYAPRVEATAHLLTELCEGLADEWDVTVVTGAAPGQPKGRTHRNGVEVVRTRSTTLGKGRLSRRGADYASFVALGVPVAVTQRRPDVVLALTDPPFVGAGARAVARRFGVPYVLVCQDVFPETARAVGAIDNAVALKGLAKLVEPAFRAADRVVALGETMRRRLEAKGVPAGRIHVIPNWTDVRAITPQPQDNDWARAEGLAGRFVAMHFGNLGYAQDLDTLVRAAAQLRDLDDLVVAVVGTGSRAGALRSLARELGAERVRFVAHQPRERAALCLAAGSVHVVGLARGLAGYVVPSRIYGVLAAGRPTIVAAERDSETAQLVRRGRCGAVVPPGDPEALAASIRDAHAGSFPLEDWGRRARELAEAEADRTVAVARYRELLRDVAEPHRKALPVA